MPLSWAQAEHPKLLAMPEVLLDEAKDFAELVQQKPLKIMQASK